jgi:hypothetical protein
MARARNARPASSPRLGTRPGGFSHAARANPVGCLVSRQHVVDSSDAAICTTPDGEPLQSEGRTGTVSQQVLEALKITRHVAVDERDPDACVHRKPTVLSSAHVGRRIGVEELLHTEPTHDTTAHLLGERGQISVVDRPSRQERRRLITVRHDNAIDHARMQMHVVIERGSESVQKGDGADARASRDRPFTFTGRASRAAEQPLDLTDEDPREGCDRALAAGVARGGGNSPCRSAGCPSAAWPSDRTHHDRAHHDHAVWTAGLRRQAEPPGSRRGLLVGRYGTLDAQPRPNHSSRLPGRRLLRPRALAVEEKRSKGSGKGHRARAAFANAVLEELGCEDAL